MGSLPERSLARSAESARAVPSCWRGCGKPEAFITPEGPACRIGAGRGGVEPLRQRSELGAFLSDTAELYGTEEIVGRAVQGRREPVFVATKTGGSWWRFCTSG